MVRSVFATILSCAAAAVCLCCHGQTTGGGGRLIPFCQPALQLRQDSAPSTSTTSATLHEQPVSAAEPRPVPAETSLVTAVSHPELHGSFVRHDELYLVRNEPHFDRYIDRFTDDVYRPEILYLGKLPVTLSVWTAIKRKNPLCFLLNPIVFQASW